MNDTLCDVAKRRYSSQNLFATAPLHHSARYLSNDEFFINYSANSNYPDKTNKVEILKEFFSNWVKIRQKVKRKKFA